VGAKASLTEGNEVMEKRKRQEGITPGQAKSQTQRWQPLQPNLERVNEEARRSGQTRFAAHERTAARQRRPETFDFLGFSLLQRHIERRATRKQCRKAA
jgi:hypothetical protein